MAGGGGTNTVTRTELDPTMRPYVEYGLKEAQNLYQSELPAFYPGQTYIGPSQTTQAAMQMAQDRAAAGSPLTRGAQQTVGALQTAVNPALGGFSDIFSRSMYMPGADVYGAMSSGAMSDTTNQGRANALYQSAGFDPSRGFYAGLGSGDFSDVANMQRANQLYGQASLGDPSADFYRAMQQGQFANAAFNPTMQTASGAYLSGNPFFEGAFTPAARAAEQQFSDAMQRINSQASQAGRYGSTAMGQLQDRAGGQFAQALTDTAGQLAYQNYAAERGFQESSIGRLGALSQQDVANRLTGAQSITSGAQQTLANQLGMMQASAALNQQDVANRLSGATALTQSERAAQAERQAAIAQSAGLRQQDVANRLAGANAMTQSYQNAINQQLQAMTGLAGTAESDYARQLQAAAMSPEMASQDYADIQRLLDIGQVQEGYQELAMADAMNRFNYEQMQPYNKLQSYLSAAYGAPQGMQVSQPLYRNPLSGAIGGGLAGFGLSGGNPFISAGGAALGGLLG
jgi:hypothetical protein